MTTRKGRPPRHPLSIRAHELGLDLADVAALADISLARLKNYTQGQGCPGDVAARLVSILGQDAKALGLEIAGPRSLGVLRWCRRVITTRHTRAVAEACNVSLSTVQRWRTPNSPGPTPEQVAVIAKIVGHPFTDPAVCLTCGQELP